MTLPVTLMLLYTALAGVPAIASSDWELRERVVRLETQMEILTNEITRLRDAKDSRTCILVESANTGTLSELGDKETSEELVRREPFEIKEIRREKMSTGYRMIVQYKLRNPKKNVPTVWATGGSQYLRSETLKNASSGLVETAVNLDSENLHYLMATLYSDELVYSLQLDIYEEGTAEATDFPLPQLDVHPPREIVYKRGQNVVVNITVKKDTPTVFTSGLMINLDDNYTIFQSHLHSNFYNETTTKTYMDTEERSVVINTSKFHVSGVVTLHVSKYNVNQLLYSMEIARKLVIRPSDQPGRFPLGFVQFYRNPRTARRDRDGPYLCAKTKAEACSVRWEVVGERIKDFRIGRLLNNSNAFEEVPQTAMLEEVKLSYRWFKVLGLERFASGDMQQEFQCFAKGALGNTIEEIKKVIFYTPVNFLENQTAIQVLNETFYDVTCGASGDPAPNLYFSYGSYEDYNYMYEDYGDEMNGEDFPTFELYETFSNHVPDFEDRIGDTVIARSVIKMTDEAGEPLRFIHCVAFQNTTGKTTVHEYPMPDPEDSD